LTDVCNAEIKKKVIFSTVSYVLGFSFVFILFGASASYLGGFFYKYKGAIRIIGGILIIVFGVHLTGMIRIPGLDLPLYRPFVRIDTDCCREPRYGQSGGFASRCLFGWIGLTIYYHVHFHQFYFNIY
jgi:cytochrome c biogenesis protein CcdA